MTLSSHQPPSARIARGLLSLIALLLLLAGIPAALLVVADSPLPSTVPDLNEVTGILTRRDDGTLFITAVEWIAWLGWAAFGLSCLTELGGLLRGRQAVSLPALGGTQRLAAYLISSIVLAFATTSAASAAPTAPAAPAATSAPAAAPSYTPPAPQPAPQAPTSIHVVKPGESLWGIAEEELGDGNKYRKIFKASQGLQQPTGVPDLQRPDLIHPGARLAIPEPAPQQSPEQQPPTGQHEEPSGDQEEPSGGEREPSGPADDQQPRDEPRPGEQTPEQAQPPATQPPSESQPSGETSPPPAEQPSEPSTPAPAQPSTPAPSPAGEQTPDSDWAEEISAVSYSVLAAAGLVGLLALKRLIQQQRRRPGHRIRMPQTMSHTERSSRLHQAPDTADLLDQALRTLAKHTAEAGGPLPRIHHLKVDSSNIVLHLAEPHPQLLPTAPFTPVDDTAWNLAPDKILPVEDLEDVPAPYPALVTLGIAGKTSILVDLEHTGTIALASTGASATEVLVALAIDLATSSMCDHLSVLCVGFAPDLSPALSSGRLRFLPTMADALVEARAHLQDVDHALKETELSHVRHARITGQAEHVWHPLFLLSAAPVGTDDYQLLTSFGGQGGFSAIVAVEGGDPSIELPWLLDTARTGQVALPGIEDPVVLPRVTPTTYQELVADFTTANDTESVPDPQWLDIPPEPEDLLTAMSPADPPRPTLTLLPSPAPTPPPVNLAEITPPEPGDVAVAAARFPRTTNPATGPVPPAGEPDPAQVGEKAEEASAPYIKVLGDITIIGRDTNDLSVGRAGMLIELAVFLWLNKAPSPESISRALGGARGPWSTNTRASNISRLRTWFGTSAHGEQYLTSSTYALHDDVRCDWGDFQERARRGLHILGQGHAAEGIAELAAAMDLVQGPPLASAGLDRYVWAEPIKQEMISVIVDITHTLSLALLDQGDHSAARKVLAKGLDIEPGSELLYRDLFRAEHHAGNRKGLHDAAERLLRSLQDLGLEPEPETSRLLNRLIHLPTRSA